MMTHDEMIEVLKADKSGKLIQYRYPNSLWQDCGTVGNWQPDFARLEYRIKPTPKLRPWKPEEVPVGALFKPVGGACWVAVITEVEFSGDATLIKCGTREWYLDVSKSHLYSTDGGKTWLPCGVMEDAQ